MQEFRIERKLMGSHFSLGIVHENEIVANQLLSEGIEEIHRIEMLLSEFLADSDTSRINSYAFESSVKISTECFDLISRSLDISSLTWGAFDITVGPLKRIYSFKNEAFTMPEAALIRETKERVGFKKVKLNIPAQTVSFIKEGMRISFAAIGKGYASDMVKKMWLKKGVHSGFINASGDLNAFGRKADGSSWLIGISDPYDTSKILLKIPLTNTSVATSGDYEQHFTYNGVRYSHNIDPYSGYPITGIKSVSVFSPSAELSDALATAVYVKGVKGGIDFIDQLPQTHAIIIDDRNKIYFSKDLQYEQE